MRLTLFSRLILGYFAIFILVVAVGVYSIVQLRRFNDVTWSVLQTDNRIIDYEKRLTDALLSQIRYERKFIITKDDALYDQSLLFKRDFERYLEEVTSIADNQVRSSLKSAQEHHQRYQGLVNEEVKYLKADQSYRQSWYKEEKEKAADGIMVELENLRAYSQQNAYGKIKTLAEAGANASRVAIPIIGVFLIFVIAISLLITRSITQPISTLKKKTRDIAKGDFKSDLMLSSPPEIAELAGAFNLMCNKLRDLDKMKSDFLSSMSHELRTPLTSIKEGTGLLLEGIAGPTTDKQKRLLTILAEESNRLISLVNSLLDLSKMEAGMMTYTFEQASLAPLISKAMTEIGPLVEAKRINLEAKIGEELPIIKVDCERILQALRNLIGNAVKFTPDGGRVAVSARHRDGKMEVSVADTGAGIPAEKLSTIFDKFQQATSTGSYPTQGTGLGLAIVKHIITSHGGKVWAESKPGRGSTFTFVLPT
ncbi:MAG: ATP-binding protein [Candidatus Binatia bacterium]